MRASEVGWVERVVGVDFSGAARAGSKIWLTSGRIVSTGAGRRLVVEACRPATSLPGGGVARDEALAALRALITASPDAAFGFDFPFGLPRELVDVESWTAFALRFGERFPDAATFRKTCRERADGKEWKRRTDDAAKTPFSPYNLRVYRQTYYGIRDLLAPLVADDAVAVVPMQPPEPGRALILEVCPASALKRLSLYLPYKGNQLIRRRARGAMLNELLKRNDLHLAGDTTSGTLPQGAMPPCAALRDLILRDDEGDALDSLVAAAITFWALATPEELTTDDDVARVEGYVYV